MIVASLSMVISILLIEVESLGASSRQDILYEEENVNCQPAGGGEGECRPLFSCPPVVATFRRTRPVICGFNGMVPIVCCPKPQAMHDQPRPATPKHPGNSPDLDFECGRRNGQRNPPIRGDVVGGVEAIPNSWPWMAALGRVAHGGQITWFCDGVLITPSYILTAAHCVSFSAVDLVRLGGHNLKDSAQVQTDAMVRGTVLHPEYRSSTAAHDLALLLLSRPVEITPKVSPVCLPWATADAMDLEGRQVTLTGWGATSFGGSTSDVLREVPVTVFPPARCDASYSTLPGYKQRFPTGVDSNYICAGAPGGGKDACQGDSGGPLVYNIFGKYVLAGIVSSGHGCGHASFPGLYASIIPHLSWIKEMAFTNYF